MLLTFGSLSCWDKLTFRPADKTGLDWQAAGLENGPVISQICASPLLLPDPLCMPANNQQFVSWGLQACVEPWSSGISWV